MFVQLETDGLDSFPSGYGAAMRGFFQGERQEADEFIYHDIFDSIMFPLQRKRELRQMLKLASMKNPKVVGEIGADKGGSLYHWCMLPGVKRVVAIEFRGIPYREEFEKAFPHIDFCFIHGSSYDQRAVEAVQKWLGEDSIDTLFLDGDKANFYADYKSYRDMIRDGGLMFMHDINGEPPEADFKRVAQEEHTSIIIDGSEAKELPPGFTPSSPWEAWLMFWQEKSCGVGVVYL